MTAYEAFIPLFSEPVAWHIGRMHFAGFSFGGWFRASRHVLMTGDSACSSGEIALALAATRRLQEAGCHVSVLCHPPLRETLHQAGIHTRVIEPEWPDPLEAIESAGDIVDRFEQLHPESYRHALKAFEEADLVAVAPGGQLLDGYKIVRNLLIPALAQKLGIPVVFLHQSIGPLANPAHRALVRRVFSDASLSITRDDISFAFLRELGVSESRAFPARDLLFAETYPNDTPSPSFDLGINLRIGFNGHTEPDVLKVFIKEFIRHKPGARLLVYTTSNTVPGPLADELRALACTVEPERVTYPDYVRAVSRCAVNVTDSFHGVIFSIMADRPVIALQTDFGSWKLHGTLVPGQPPIEILPGFMDAPSARDVLDRALAFGNDPNPIRERQLRFIDYCRKRAEDGWNQAERLIMNER